jgi:hypothetical protein
MPSVYQRNSRLTAAIAVLLFVTFFLVGPHYSSLSSLGGSSRPTFLPTDFELPSRLNRSQYLYKKVLDDRRELVKKFGPTPDEIVMHVPF